jgi:REP element-mobilizing transposase RayT
MTLPSRKVLHHQPPLRLHPEDNAFFVTVCCRPPGLNQLCQPDIAGPLIESVRFRHRRGDWWMRLLLLMPDHLHALVSMSPNKDLAAVVRLWKHYTAANLGIRWQRDFFDHRLRTEESLRDKADYILLNPVRKGLVKRAEGWPYVWWPEMDGRRGAPSLPNLPR